MLGAQKSGPDQPHHLITLKYVRHNVYMMHTHNKSPDAWPSPSQHSLIRAAPLSLPLPLSLFPTHLIILYAFSSGELIAFPTRAI